MPVISENESQEKQYFSCFYQSNILNTSCPQNSIFPFHHERMRARHVTRLPFPVSLKVDVATLPSSSKSTKSGF